MEKQYKIALLAGLGSLCASMFVACDKTQEVRSVASCAVVVDGLSEDGTLRAKVNEPIEFRLKGQPDYAVFYSGEPGKIYAQREKTKIEGKSELSFDYNLFKTLSQSTITYPKIVSVLISTDYSGFYKRPGTYDGAGMLSATDAQRTTEQVNIDERDKATWTDVTDNFVMDLAANKSADDFVAAGKMDISKYQGKKFFVAFKYKIQRHGENSRQIRIHNFKVQTIPDDPNVVEGGVVDVANTANAGWYYISGISGIDVPVGEPRGYAFNWNGLLNKSVGGQTVPVLCMNARYAQGGTPVPPFEEGWAIAKMLDLNSMQPSKGVSIKAYTSTTISAYKYIYEKPGTYTVTFVFTNGNMLDGMASRTQEMKIVVEP